MRTIVILLWIVTATRAVAQSFVGEASLPAISADGFYRIEVDPAFNPYLNDDLSNVRIMGQDNREVPYLLQRQPRVLHTQRFREYAILENKRARKYSSLTLINADSLPINNISLWIKNADVSKTVVLLGSDDGEQWFALKHNFTIGPFKNPAGVSEVNIVDFPLSNYRYYRFTFDDSLSAPINILRSGFYEAVTQNIYPAIIPSRIFERDTTEKRTSVTIRFDSARMIDALSVRMGAVPYFLRNASLFTCEYRFDKNGVRKKHYRFLDEFQLTSKHSTDVGLDGQKVTELLLIIDNDDNPPLHVQNISAHQVRRYFTAWLRAGEHYKLKIGDAGLQQPSYDLKFFQDSIPASTPIVKPAMLTLYKQPTAVSSSTTFFTRESIVWLALGVIVILLSVMSARLIKDMRK